jgi:hypothetical protein
MDEKDNGRASKTRWIFPSEEEKCGDEPCPLGLLTVFSTLPLPFSERIEKYKKVAFWK